MLFDIIVTVVRSNCRLRKKMLYVFMLKQHVEELCFMLKLARKKENSISLQLVKGGESGKGKTT